VAGDEQFVNVGERRDVDGAGEPIEVAQVGGGGLLGASLLA